MDFSNLRNRWKDFIAKDKLDSLFKELHSRIVHDSLLYDDFVLISNQYNNLIRENKLAIISQSETTLMRNRITKGVLQLVSELQNEDLKENDSKINSSLFGKEWVMEDYYRWVKRKISLHKISFIEAKSSGDEKESEYSCITSIISAHFHSRYYDYDTLLIKRRDYKIEFHDPVMSQGELAFVSHTSPSCNEMDHTIFIPLDIVSKVEFVESNGDEGFQLISPKSLFLLKIFTKGKHVCFIPGPVLNDEILFENDSVLTDVIALVFTDRELCLNAMNVIQFILNERDSYPFDEKSGRPIIPFN